jgi:hypothetical protein
VSAPPDILKLARRFPIRSRGEIYSIIARSPRMAQLAETFPLLAYAINVGSSDHWRYRSSRRNLAPAAQAMRMVKAGAKLNAVAGLMEIPLALRKLKPGAVFWNLELIGALRDLGEHHCTI